MAHARFVKDYRRARRLLRGAADALTQELIAAGDDDHPVIADHRKLRDAIRKFLATTPFPGL